MLAAAQAVHAVGDSLAHVVYFGLGLNIPAKPFEERKVSLSSVIRKLENDSDALEIRRALETLRDDAAFAHIESLVTYGKQRGLPDIMLSIEPEGRDVPYEIEYGAFAMDGQTRAGKEVEVTLAPAYAVSSRAIVDTGNAVRKYLTMKSV